MSRRPTIEDSDQTSALAQTLEDAMGCRALVASMLLLDSSSETAAELAASDAHLSRLIAETLQRLGLRTPNVH